MPERRSILAGLLLALVGLARLAQADDLRIDLPDDTKFVVRVNLPALQKSTVGGWLFDNAKGALLAKLSDKAEGQGLTQEKIVELLGFDPLEEIQDVVVAAADYDSPEKSLVVCVRLRKTSGNLEGMLLALPGYHAEDHGGRQLYSAKPDENTPVFGALHVDAGGNRTVLMSAERDSVIRMLDSLDAKSQAGATAKSVTVGGDATSLATVDVFDLPKEVVEQEGAPANVAKIIRHVAARLSEADARLTVATSITAEADKQAEQLEQMVKGLSAMVSLAADTDAEDEDLRRIQALLTDLTVKRNGAAVELSLSVPADDVRKLIEDELLKD